MTWWQILLGSIGTLVVAAGGYITARSGHRSSPYDRIVDRLEKLEASDGAKTDQIIALRQQVMVLTGDTDILSEALWVQWQWVESGAMPPPPTISAAALEVVQRRRTHPYFPLTPSGIIQDPIKPQE